MKMLFSEVKQLITKHEGVRLKPYKDSVGKLTIGIGRNLDDVGILPSEADFMLTNDITRAEEDAKDLLPGIMDYKAFEDLSANRQYVLVDMCFNMGKTGVKGFKKMLAALAMGNYEEASKEMLNSKWAKQVGPRADTLAKLMVQG